MSWSVYDESLEFHAGPSRSLAAWMALGHLLAGVAALAAGLPLLVLAPVLASLLIGLRRALRPLGAGVRAIGWSAAGGWQRIGLGTNRDGMELRPSSVVTNSALFMHWDDGCSTWRILLPRDAMHADDWRRMRVIVGLYQGRDRMPAAAGFVTSAGRTSSTAPGLQQWRMDLPGFRGAGPHGHEKQRPIAGRKSPAR